MIGKNITHYRVTVKLGAGGMGEVYRAQDERLGREVALKMLPPAFAADGERMARFQREAQMLASLNHPNIGSIYGLEESDGVRALVMELVDGPTLAERIAAGPIPVADALQIAEQISEALEYAHEHGIVHRDLKPANIKVTQDGTVKVLDFGLAKAFGEESSAVDIANSPTISVAATRAGVILGTAAYMSPEQAAGKQTDKRSDIWSFGVMLWEMLTAKQLFTGDTISHVLADVLKSEPDWNSLPASVPATIRHLLRRCLTRSVKDRLRDIGEARVTLERYLAEPQAEELGAARPALASRRPQDWLTLAGALAIGGLITAAAFWTWRPAVPGLPLRKLDLTVPKLDVSLFVYPVLSPDGRKVVYSSEDRLWIREFDQFEPRQLPATEKAELLFWSPDSAYVGFVADGKFWKIPASGGEKKPLANAMTEAVGAAETPGDSRA